MQCRALWKDYPPLCLCTSQQATYFSMLMGASLGRDISGLGHIGLVTYRGVPVVSTIKTPFNLIA